jgi:DNA-binding ferritin-like protein (Dps family)
MTVSQHLNKSASKVEKNQEQLLEENRKKSVMDILREEQLEDRRTIKKDVNKTIEQLLSDSKEDWGHQYSDDDLKNFAHELGLDHNLEELREDNDVV